MLKRLCLLLVALGLPSLLGQRTGVFAATGDAVAEPPVTGWQGLPDARSAPTWNPNDPNVPVTPGSPRFLTVSGNKNFTIPAAAAENVVRLTFVPTPGDPTIQIRLFDADYRGLWDQRIDGEFVTHAPNTKYQVFADPNNTSTDATFFTTAPLVATLNSNTLTTDAGWTELLNLAPNHPSALLAKNASDGRFHFVVRTQLELTYTTEGGTATGYEVNGYKIAFNGTYMFSKGQAVGFTGGAVDALVVLLPGNTQLLTSNDLPPTQQTEEGITPDYYDGVIDFLFDPSNFCTALTMSNGDADWDPGQDDANGSWGVPPDNGRQYQNPQDTPPGPRDARPLRVGAPIQFELRTPANALHFASLTDPRTGGGSPTGGHPSIDQSRHGTALQPNFPASDVNGDVFQDVAFTQGETDAMKAIPGVWTYRWTGVDAHNSVFIKFNQDFGTTPRKPLTKGRIWCDADLDGTFDVGETVFAGVTLTFTPGGATATTDANGEWSVQLAPGSYSVTFASQPCATPRTPLPRTFTVDACNDGRLDIPMDCTLTVTGRVFCDNNANNVFDAGDTPLSGNVNVRLEKLDAAQQVVQTINTTTTGGLNWTATGLSFGTWRAFVPAGQALTDALVKTSTQPQTFTLDAQNCTRVIDFGYRCNQSLCVRLFCDPNGNCIFDTGDIAIFPVTVTVKNAAGATVATKTALDAGFVCFDVPPGTYTIELGPLPPAYVNAVLRNPLLPVVVGTQRVDVLLCYECPNPARIHGKVFKENCVNTCDGIIDNDIVPIAGVLVSLVGTNPVRPPQVDVTDANGDYAFENLLPGTYAVSVNGADPLFFNLTPTSSTTVPATVLPGDDVMVNFPWCECAKARVHGYVFKNPPCTCDGSFDDGDTPIPGVRVTLTGTVSGGVVALEDFTDATGHYEFEDLQPGTYTVAVDGASPQLVNLTPGTPTEVGPFVLGPGEERRVDFGYCQAKVCGFVQRFPPCTCDGNPDPAAQPVPGVTVQMVKVNPPTAVWTATTGADGGYCFEDVGPGTYEVTVPAGQAGLDGLTPTGPTVHTVTVDAGECHVDVNFKFTPPPKQKLCAKVFVEPEGQCDGNFDEGRDKWVPWIEVFVAFQGDDGYEASGFTDRDGRVCFDDLAPGKYVIYVGANQPALANHKPSTPNCYKVCLGPCEEACAKFGWCKTCVPGPCCEGDLNAALVGTAFWLGDCVRDLKLKVRLLQGCDCGSRAKELDSVALNWRATFPGQTNGLNGIVSVVDVKVKNGVAYVVLKLTAAGAAFLDGAFGKGEYRLEVTLNGKTHDACARLRCESFRPGMLFTWDRHCGKIPPCEDGWRWDGKSCWDAPWLKCGSKVRARFLVLNTWSRQSRECQKCTKCNDCTNCPTCKEILTTKCAPLTRG